MKKVGIQKREERDKDTYALKWEDDKYSLHTYLEIQVLLDTETIFKIQL
jgi:heat shock protein HspQ